MNVANDADDGKRWSEVLELVGQIMDLLEGHEPTVCAATIAVLAASDLSARAASRQEFAANFLHFSEKVSTVGQKMFEDMEENPEAFEHPAYAERSA